MVGGMSGIVSYGVYLPYWRLQRTAIAQALGSGGGKGTRRVASYDEDSTSMGVEAARVALRHAPDGAVPADVVFATTTPAYADKTNATAVHAALALPSHARVHVRRSDPRTRRDGRCPHRPAGWRRRGGRWRRRRRLPVR
jgi:3-hydroxy-3-methylglutaryl CoA synthase